MTETEPKIDFTTIDFPSDVVTIKMLRQAWPDATDIDREERFLKDEDSYRVNRLYARHSLDATLGGCLIDAEREIAERAFKVALGNPLEGEDNRLKNRDEMIECLTSEYQRYGLAHGEHDTTVLVERIEAQAAAQARQYGRKR